MEETGMTVDNIIKEKLSAIGESYDELKPKMIQRLVDIEMLFREKEKKKSEARKILEDEKYSLVSIADELGCSRTTFYNHDRLLQRYIEYSIDEYSKNDPWAIIAQQKQTISELNEKIALMEARDVKELLLKEQLLDTERRLMDKQEEVERLKMARARATKV